MTNIRKLHRSDWCHHKGTVAVDEFNNEIAYHWEGIEYSIWYYCTDDGDCKLAVYCDEGDENKLVCRLHRFAMVAELDPANRCDALILDAVLAEAIEWDFPLHHPKGSMTWRELRDRLNDYSDEVLDMEALVWLPPEVSGYDHDAFESIADLSPFDAGEDVSEYNMLSITLAED